MALSEEQIKEARAKYNIPDKGVESSGVTSTARKAELQAMWDQSSEPLAPNQDFSAPAEPQSFADTIKDVPNDFLGIGKGILDSFKQKTERIGENIDRRIKEPGNVVSDIAGTLLDVGGATLGTLSDAVFHAGLGAVKMTLDPSQEEQIGKIVEKGATAIADTTPVKAVISKWNEYEAANPEAAANLKAGGDFASFLGDFAGLKVGTKAADVVLDASVKVIKKASPKVAAATSKEGYQAYKAANATMVKENIDDIVGQITQAKKPANKEAAARALASIEPQDISSYSDLSNSMQLKIETLSTKMDDLLNEDKTLRTKESLAIKTDVEGTTVIQNPVEEAIGHLEELYNKTNDPISGVRIANLRDKLEAEGLTRTEVNNLAKQYGIEFKSKAFSKATGDPLTSVGAEASENTRKSLKEVVRKTFKEEVGTDGKVVENPAMAIDRQISDLYTTKKLTDKMMERVAAAENKMRKIGGLEKFATMAGSILDALTLHSVRGLAKGVGVGTTSKSLDALELQSQLSKNIARFNQVVDKGNKTEIMDFLHSIFGDTKDNLGVGLSTKDVSGIPANVRPDLVAKSLDEADAILIKKFLDNPNDLSAYIELKPILEGAQIDKADVATQTRFLEDVIKESSFKRGETPEKLIPNSHKLDGIDPDVLQEAHISNSLEEFKRSSRDFEHGLSDSEMSDIFDLIKKRNQDPALKALEDYKLAALGNAAEPGKELFQALSKSPQTAEVLHKESVKMLKEEGIATLYRYGSREGNSWSIEPQTFFENGRFLEELEVTEDVLDRVVYYEGAEVRSGLSPAFSNAGEGEVILKTAKKD